MLPRNLRRIFGYTCLILSAHFATSWYIKYRALESFPHSMPLAKPSKAGISWPTQELTSDPVAKFFQSGSQLSWHWNWSKHWTGPILPHTSPNLEIDAEFIPMIWSPDSLHDGNELEPGWKFLLGFNEPDHKNPVVASYRTPAGAAAAWVELAALRTSTDQKLVSPAIAWDFEWLKEFLSLIPDSTLPDYLAVHVYTTTFESFKEILERYWHTFRMPIILTEFAFQSFDPQVPPATSQQQVHDFMGQTTKWLDDTPWISKYSWFGAVRNPYHLHGVHPFNRLMDEQGEITPLGWQYINGGHD